MTANSWTKAPHNRSVLPQGLRIQSGPSRSKRGVFQRARAKRGREKGEKEPKNPVDPKSFDQLNHRVESEKKN
jgi:hypothetical protein